MRLSVLPASRSSIDCFSTRATPLTLLSQVAARTERIELGTLVLCAPFRPPAQLAREAKTLTEASRGRFILGIGAGWHQPEFDAFGFPFDHLVSRFEEYAEVLTRLLGDRPADFEGRYHVLRQGQVYGDPAPPPWIAAAGPRMLSLTGRLAGGWNGAWYGSDPSLFKARLAEVEAALRAAGRERSELIASAGLLVMPGEREQAAAITGTLDEVAGAIQRFRAAGRDHDVGTGRDELGSDCKAEPLAAAGHNRGTAVKRDFHGGFL